MKQSLASLGIGLVLLGALIGYLGWRNVPARAVTQRPPEQVTLGSLVARGTNTPSYVTVTDAAYCRDYAILADSNNDWHKVWIPVAPARQGSSSNPPLRVQMENVTKLAGEPKGVLGQRSDGLASPQQMVVLVATSRPKNASQVAVLCNQPTITGVVTNPLRPLTSREVAVLIEAFPHAELDKCIILDLDWDAPGWLSTWGLVLFGTIVGLAGIGILVMTVWHARGKGRNSTPDESLKRWLEDVGEGK